MFELANDVATLAAAGYSPTDMGADLAAGAGTILGYVGIGVGAAVGVALALIGIRRGIGIFRAQAK